MSVRTSLYVFPDEYAFEYDLSERRRDELLLLLIDSRRVVTVSAFGIRSSTRRLMLYAVVVKTMVHYRRVG